MAAYKTLQESALSPNYSYLECDICGSADIVDTRGGYVCRKCGIVLEIQKLQYDRPYNEDIIQYAKGLGITQVGTKRERGISANSMKLHRLNKHNSIIDNERAVIDKARVEISRIFNCLSLAEYNSIKKMALDKFKIVRNKLRPGSKYRNIEKLSSIIIYFCLKLRNVSINPHELIDISMITKKEFNDFILQIQTYLPAYAERNRQDYILQRVLEISEHFELGLPFYFLTKKILYRLWNGIKNTTDNAVAGLVSSISLLCSGNEKITVSAICNRLGIRMSTIQSQVKRKVFDRFKVEGFISLIKSSDLLVQIMKKLSLVESEEQEEVAIENQYEVVLGNATEVFNQHNNLDYYYFAVKGERCSPILITLKINEFPLNFEKPLKVKNDALIDFEIYKYYSCKDPPMIKL
ncbi:MAG: TFIIB-type zinc ribbon-containing protein [Candidatus Hodarchaeota archaeon]